MKNNMKGGIYKITNSATGSFYIGSSNNILRRKYEHYWLLRLDKHSNNKLQSAWNEYSEVSFQFEVIEYCIDDVLLEREQYYLDETQCHKYGYNIASNAYQNNQNQIPVYQLDYVTLEIVDQYDSMQQAEILLGGIESWRKDNIGACIRGKQTSAYGFRWCRIDDQKIQINSSKWYPRAVQKLDPSTGQVLGLFNSIKEANLFHKKHCDNHSIRHAIESGEIHLDVHWRYYNLEGDEVQSLYVGIDVGKNGAVVIIDNRFNRIWKYIIPTVGNEYDMYAINVYLKSHAHLIKHCIIEDVHAIQGPIGNSSNFQFGRGKGLLEMCVMCHNIPHTLVQAKEWQKYAWEGVSKQTLPTTRKLKDGTNATKVDTKSTSLIAAKRLFPNVTLTKSARATVPHDGIVDALLIAETCRRKFK